MGETMSRQETNDIQKRSDILGAILTALLWALAIVLCFAVKIAPPHPDYKVIQIQLADVQPVKTEAPVQTAPVVKETPVEQPKAVAPQEVPVAQTAKTTPVKTAPAKSAPAKTTTSKTSAPAKAQPVAPKEENPVLQKSVDDLMAESRAAPKKQTTWDDSLFSDSDDVVETTTKPAVNTTTTAKSSSSFSGTAASGSSAASESKSASASSSKAATGTASSSTTAALGKIADATYTQTSTGGVTSSAVISSGNKNGHVAFQMAEGSARELLSPSKPVITISDANAKYISNKVTEVTITFKVLAGGTVPLSGISIKPASLLPLEIQNEVKAQISTWRFAADPYDGQATFEYSIITDK